MTTSVGSFRDRFGDWLAKAYLLGLQALFVVGGTILLIRLWVVTEMPSHLQAWAHQLATALLTK